MKIAAMQPTYLPWMGYFNLICTADTFVFLDDAQFERRSWHNRNRVILAGKLTWLTVPVLSKGSFGQKIIDTKIISDSPWKRAHAATLMAAYAKAPHKDVIFELAKLYDHFEFTSICELNIQLIGWISNVLEIKTEIVRTSELDIPGKRSERLLRLCRTLGASEYLSPRGARDYIEADGVFAQENFPVSYQDFRPPAYRDSSPLHAGEFPSILDAIAYLGPAGTKALVMEKCYER